ncbi:folate alpha receptor, partial [Mytilus galloprovincialis]
LGKNVLLLTDGYLDICMDGVYQKEAPGPGELYGQCAEWKERNCCYENTTKSLQKPEPWQNFNLNHCGQLSPMCRGHFLQNFCFYECSPNVGPWLV